MEKRRCPKCGEEGLKVKYISKGELIDSSSNTDINTEFLASSRYEYYYKITSKKEHLVIMCKTCKFMWRDNTNDDKGRAS